MDITIGVQHGIRELVVASPLTLEQARSLVADALASQALLELDDERGGHYVIPTASIGFVHIDSGKTRTVGFGAL